MSRGQPTKYRPEYCDGIIEFMKDGKSITQYAAEIKISRTLVYDWAKAHPEFQEAMETAVTASEAFWENWGQQKVKENDPITNSTWMIFMMKNCYKWRDKHADEDSKQVINVNFGYDPEVPLDVETTTEPA
jgi:hypothetical protein